MAKLLEQSDPKEAESVRDELSSVEQQIRPASKSACVASVDSEMALVRGKSYLLEGWLLDRSFIGFRGKEIEKMPQRMLVTSRLDGPSEAIVCMISDDAIRAE